jgi:hypothetical protein
MTHSHAFRRFAFAYGVAFAVLYVIALKLDLALFTVYPSLGIVLPGTHHSQDTVDPAMGFLAPAMYWYGWTATAALGALGVGLVAALVPREFSRWFWVGWLWVTPVLAMVACVYLTLPWFRLKPVTGQGPAVPKSGREISIRTGNPDATGGAGVWEGGKGVGGGGEAGSATGFKKAI